MSDAISTSNVWPFYSAKNKSITSENNDSLGKDDFLKILLTQLANQDPMQPMQDREFIAQMAQFTAVEQMTKMSGEMKLMRQALGASPALIGKEIQWIELDDKGDKVTRSGIVEALTFKDGAQYAVVGKESISMDQILRIGNPQEQPPTDPTDEIEDPDDKEEAPGEIENPEDTEGIPPGEEEPGEGETGPAEDGA
ncbi:flagellar hook capping FlgD N-terminal domain-containing protein [Paenibacillus sp. J2TS4]|uniref:flagellar hook capping FlgD N-terminal domain-containing protein n=1 Tax=Paenibacillus sp. J2TS4 TaxID=2807194 RepID=UPI001B2D871E|nr:flagellar hook capping FlgD N-terminal domain-containing protein [Paenibacillus sp. J2TS4]GIP33071.1 hypothetical protein J2TS4_22810 [Paenibacillus sp. J2TS4]